MFKGSPGTHTMMYDKFLPIYVDTQVNNRHSIIHNVVLIVL